MVVVWAGWLNRLEEGRVSLSVGGSQSRPLGVGAGVDGKEVFGAEVHGGAEGVLGGGTWEGGVMTDEIGREEASEAGLSETGVGGGALTEDLADD